jgi:hypothetical protein
LDSKNKISRRRRGGKGNSDQDSEKAGNIYQDLHA